MVDFKVGDMSLTSTRMVHPGADQVERGRGQALARPRRLERWAEIIGSWSTTCLITTSSTASRR